MRVQLKPLQLTLAILKPHVVCNPVALEDIRRMVLEREFKIVRANRQRLRQAEAENFYSEHRGKFFFNRLVTFMTSGPIELYILARENAIAEWRKLMGPTKVFKTQFSDPDTIRGKFGLSDTRNAAHGSDSVESATAEMKFFFPEFDAEKWYAAEELSYRTGPLVFEPEKFTHFPVSRVINRHE